MKTNVCKIALMFLIGTALRCCSIHAVKIL